MDLGGVICGLSMGLVITAFGLFLMYIGLREYKLYRLIIDTPTSNINSVERGTVEIKGEAEPIDDDLEFAVAPYSGKTCAYYHTELQRFKGGRKRSKWKTVWEKKYQEPFLVTDDTGTIVVDPKGADYDIRTKKNVIDTHYIFTKTTEAIDFAKKVGVDIKSLVGLNMRFRIRETMIPAAKKVYVLGTARNVPIKSAITDVFDVEELTVMKSIPKGILHISDMNEEELVRKVRNRMIGYSIVGGIITVPMALLTLMFFVSIFV